MPAQVDWSRVIGRGELWRLCRAKLRLGPSQTFFQDRPTFFLTFARSQPNFRKSLAKSLTFEALPPHAPYPTKPRRERYRVLPVGQAGRAPPPAAGPHEDGERRAVLDSQERRPRAQRERPGGVRVEDLKRGEGRSRARDAQRRPCVRKPVRANIATTL